jgi:ABC-type nitrate/sulfonate/bicarbonate transport system permease component
MLLLLYLGYRDHRCMPLLILGSIGQVSMVNTFAHIHTPFIISFIRSINGFILGIAAGLVLTAVLKLWRLLEKRWQSG